MTKQIQRYFYLEDTSSTIFWSLTEQENRSDLIFLGSSMNPNIRMTAAVMAKGQLKREHGWKVKELV